MPRYSTAQKIATTTYDNIQIIASTQLIGVVLAYHTPLPEVFGSIGSAAFNSAATMFTKCTGILIDNNLKDQKQKTILLALDRMQKEIKSDAPLQQKLKDALAIMHFCDLEPIDFTDSEIKHRLADSLDIDDLSDLDLLLHNESTGVFIMKHYVPQILAGAIAMGVGTTCGLIPIPVPIANNIVQSVATLASYEVVSRFVSYVVESQYPDLEINQSNETPTIFMDKDTEVSVNVDQSERTVSV
ncbi:hypothetical protein L3V82_03260 [Thiotrichales bacterium 19S3-7]|nr:hypothetical protein [Thiotrichales bacterium 19S3-7]MCF6801189.1 hypothetical protein [Thiotrichales bacterium 19S3-11]